MDADSVVVSAGSVFAISGGSGDIQPGATEGFFSHDTRFLSTYRLTLNGRKPTLIRSSTFDYALASFYLSSSAGRGLPSGTISMVRDRYVTHGLHEDITLVNHSPAATTIRLELTFHADFADIFEVRAGRLRKVERTAVEEREGQHISLVYRRGSFHREAWIAFSGEPVIRGRRAAFDLTLQPKESWRTCVTILPVVDAAPSPMRCADEVMGPPFGAYRPEKRPPFEHLTKGKGQQPMEDEPRLKTELAGLQQGYDQALADLRALRVQQQSGHYILAAGLPWYMAVFGRDSIISSIQTKLLGPELMVGTLDTLARLQATVRDDFRDAEPGKFPHEVRQEIGQAEKDEFLGGACALLFPVDWPEPFGVVMIEAMACGTPTIAYRRGSIPEVIQQGVTGFIVGNQEEAVEAVERLPTLSRRRCRQAFEERFTASRMAGDYLSIYQRLCKVARPTPRRTAVVEHPVSLRKGPVITTKDGRSVA